MPIITGQLNKDFLITVIDVKLEYGPDGSIQAVDIV